MCAASFEDTNEDLINKKRQTHNKTQKQYPRDRFDADKVNSMLSHIQHGNDNSSELGDFQSNSFSSSFSPPSKSIDSKSIDSKSIDQRSSNPKQKIVDSKQTMETINQQDLDTNNLDQNYGATSEYYKPAAVSTNQDPLLQKINYMINLLEEQQDERTNTVTEEVVLYSFLGIFVIFVVDSFVRVGKYVR